eukprot:3311582-Rhodomonas_salina.2
MRRLCRIEGLARERSDRKSGRSPEKLGTDVGYGGRRSSVLTWAAVVPEKKAAKEAMLEYLGPGATNCHSRRCSVLSPRMVLPGLNNRQLRERAERIISCYAFAMHCPVLTYPRYAVSGTDLAYAATRCLRRSMKTAEVSSAIRLRARYAMSGTDLAYGGRHIGQERVAKVFFQAAVRGFCGLRDCYAVPGTDIAYGVLCNPRY